MTAPDGPCKVCDDKDPTCAHCHWQFPTIEELAKRAIDEQVAEAYTQGFNDGLRNGYAQGELERQALATSNSDLRSDLLRLRQARQGKLA